MHPTVDAVTKRIIERSRATRQDYLDRMGELKAQSPQRSTLSCGNLAHGFAACNQSDKDTLKFMNKANVAIVSAYNDMLSAHQPYQDFPDVIRKAANGMGSVAQFAGGTPAMCDGVTQGQPGMELSLFSRDTIAMSTSVALSHNMFDATMLLGICDKIVPGLLIGSLSFGYLPTILVPAGPMPSGLPNKEKQRIRQLYAEGKIGKDELLEAESQSYHSPGTCTFYGTANSNQLLVEVMGLHLPGSAFVNPGTPLREALTREATEQVIRLSKPHGGTLGLGGMVDEKSIVNALVALLVVSFVVDIFVTKAVPKPTVFGGNASWPTESALWVAAPSNWFARWALTCSGVLILTWNSLTTRTLPQNTSRCVSCIATLGGLVGCTGMVLSGCVDAFEDADNHAVFLALAFFGLNSFALLVGAIQVTYERRHRCAYGAFMIAICLTVLRSCIDTDSYADAANANAVARAVGWPTRIASRVIVTVSWDSPLLALELAVARGVTAVAFTTIIRTPATACTRPLAWTIVTAAAVALSEVKIGRAHV